MTTEVGILVLSPGIWTPVRHNFLGLIVKSLSIGDHWTPLQYALPGQSQADPRPLFIRWNTFLLQLRGSSSITGAQNVAQQIDS